MESGRLTALTFSGQSHGMYKIIGADGKEYGPIPLEILRRWIIEGRADARTRVRAEGTAEWRPLGEVPELSALLAGAPAPEAPSAGLPGAAAPKTNALAMAGMIMGIVAITCAPCCCYGLPFNVLGIIFSAIALSQIKQDPAGQQGRGMAVAGLVLSIISIVLAFLALALGVAFKTSDILRHIQNR